MQIPSNAPMTVTLVAQDWQMMLKILDDQMVAPHRITAPLIQAIIAQLEAPPGRPPGNGVDRYAAAETADPA